MKMLEAAEMLDGLHQARLFPGGSANIISSITVSSLLAVGSHFSEGMSGSRNIARTSFKNVQVCLIPGDEALQHKGNAVFVNSS